MPPTAPTLQLFGIDPESGTPKQKFTLEKKDRRQTYVLRLRPEGDPAQPLTVDQTDIPPEHLESDNLAVAALHYDPSGHLFLEVLHKTEKLYNRQWTGKRTAPPFREVGTIPNHSVYLQLEEDKEFYFGGQRFAVEVGSSVDEIATLDRKPIPKLQVAHSMQDFIRSGDLDHFTPNFPETIPEEAKVYETPAVKSRYLDPNSSPRQRPESPLKPINLEHDFVASRSKSGLIAGGHMGGRPGEPGDTQLSNIDDADLSASDDEDDGGTREETFTSAQRPIAVDSEMGLDGITATPGTEIPYIKYHDDAPVASMFGNSGGVTSPSEPGSQSEPVSSTAPEFPKSPSLTQYQTAPSPTKPESPKGSAVSADAEATGGDKQPDSLPEGFLIKKLKRTPAKKYGKRRSSTKSPQDAKFSATVHREQTVETEASTAPLTAAQKKLQKRKAEKPRDTESTASESESELRESKKRKTSADADEDVDMQEAVAEEAEVEIAEAPKRRRGRPKKSDTSISVVMKSTKKTPRGKKAVDGEGESAAESPAPAKLTRKPREKRPPTPPVEESEPPRNDTQYTFPEPDVSEEEEEVVSKLRGPKTPKLRKTPTAKTPGTRSTAASTRKKRIFTDEPEEDKDSSPVPVNARTTDRYEEAAPRIVFSNSTLDQNKSALSFIRSNSGRVLTSATDPTCNFLVVGPGEVKRTPKLSIAIARGITIVEETWITDSRAVGYFVDPDVYIPDDPAREKEWKCKISEAIEKGKQGHNTILEDYHVYLTAALLQQVKAANQESLLVDMCMAAGATQVVKKAPRGPKDENELSVVLGVEKGDPDATTLEKDGRVVYSTALVGVGVGRGELELESDEFKVPPVDDVDEKGKKGRGRKK